MLQHNVIIPSAWPSLTVEANEAFNLTSFALSLLLVFRQVSVHISALRSDRSSYV